MQVQAFDCVGDEAVEKAEHIISKMTEHMHPRILERLHQNGADVAVIGRDQVNASLAWLWDARKRKAVCRLGFEAQQTLQEA